MTLSRNGVRLALLFGLLIALACNLPAELQDPTPTPTPPPYALATALPAATPQPTPTIAPSPTARIIYLVRTATPAPTAIPLPASTPVPAVLVDFRSDKPVIQQGACTMLRWDIEGVKAVYLDGAGVIGHGSQEVCPSKTTVYTLHIELQVGYLDRALTVLVLPAPTAVP